MKGYLMFLIQRAFFLLILTTLTNSGFTQSNNQNNSQPGYFDYAKTTLTQDAKQILNLAISFVQAPIYFDN